MLSRQLLIVRQRHLARICVPVFSRADVNSIILESHAVLRFDYLGDVIARAENARVDAGVAIRILI